MRRVRPFVHAACWLAAAALATAAAAEPASDAELAGKLNNPLSAMISVPFQGNYDCCFGPLNGGRYTLNIQPVTPIRLPGDTTLIVRTITPLIRQNRISETTGATSGFGDITQSFFFSPRPRGLIWGAGPVFLWPTGSSDLGARKWGAGPTAVLVREPGGGLTYGVLANHIWSYADAGHARRPKVSSTFVQPFLSWTSPTATTLSLNAESSYNWTHDQWSIPVNLTVSHLVKIGEQRVSLGAGVRVYMARDADPPADPAWGLRLTATFLFPK